MKILAYVLRPSYFIILALFILLGFFIWQKYIYQMNLSKKPQNTLTQVSQKTYYVSPKGSDKFGGQSENTAFLTIQKALDLALPGDIVHLAPGIYLQDIVSKRNGLETAPISIQGPKEAVIKGSGKSSRVVFLSHDYIYLHGFTIDGLVGPPDDRNNFRDKLLYLQGAEDKKGVTGVRIQQLTIKNAGGECVRLRYFAEKNELLQNTIGPCGIYDYVFNEGGKNGEGIYIGTAPEQRQDGKNPTADPDISSENWIHYNSINTQGNECVDIKEASTKNIIEYNECSGQQDPESGGLDARGNNNTFRFNTVRNNIGAGVRLGGDGKTDGIENNVYNNTIRNNKNGGIKFQRFPQGIICGNSMSQNTSGNTVGTHKTRFNPTQKCK